MMANTKNTARYCSAPDNVEIAQQQRDHRALGGGGHERRDWRRGALVNVWCPQMERNHAQLESDASDREHDPGQQKAESGPADRELPYARERHAAGIGIDEGHAEEKECSGSRSQNQILDSGFERLFEVCQVRNHGVQGDAQNLESEKE